jgi:hypothetical protein
MNAFTNVLLLVASGHEKTSLKGSLFAIVRVYHERRDADPTLECTNQMADLNNGAGRLILR